jgi:uncharacterized protein YegP (UPF0339 family)
MAGTFEITRSQKSGEFYFHLKAANGEIILQSEGYTKKASALNGIESVKKNSPTPERYERKTAKNGEFFFNLRAKNRQVIGTSETYKQESGRENGIASVKKNGPGGKVVDLTKA